MGSLVTAVAVVSILKKVAKVTAIIGIYLAFCALFPFKLVFPDEIMSIFVSGWFHDLVSSVAFFIPVKFVLSCIILILASRYSSIITNFINWIINKINFWE